jgi:hypothetical protein
MDLPRDIGIVIQLASAPQPLLHDVAAQISEAENTIVEASRFYLQQALFQTDASAYRLLGVAADATPERIREHYRWLQRWLHPDRRGEDWEALFASRVNWAWGHLRNDKKRRAYDLECKRQDSIGSDIPQPDELSAPGGVRFLYVVPEGNSWPKRIAVGALLGSCVALLYLASTNDDTRLQENVGASPVTAASVEPERVAKSVTPQIPVSDQTPGTETIAANAPPAVVEAATVHPNDGTPQPGDHAQTAAFTNSASTPNLKNESASVSAPGAMIAAVSRSETVSQHGVQTTPSQPVVAPPKAKAVTQPTTEPNERKSRGSSAPAALAAQATDTDVRINRQSAVPQIAADASNTTASIPDAAQAPRQIEAVTTSQASLTSRSQPVVTLVDHRAQAPDPPQKADSGASAVAVDSLARLDLARARVNELSKFFGGPDMRSPPVWNDAAGQVSAEHQRSAMHERSRLRNLGDFVVDAPVWRLSDQSVSLSAGYYLRNGRSVFESGHISLSMIWREKMWLVTHVELNPTQ